MKRRCRYLRLSTLRSHGCFYNHGRQATSQPQLQRAMGDVAAHQDPEAADDEHRKGGAQSGLQRYQRAVGVSEADRAWFRLRARSNGFVSLGVGRQGREELAQLAMTAIRQITSSSGADRSDHSCRTNGRRPCARTRPRPSPAPSIMAARHVLIAAVALAIASPIPGSVKCRGAARVAPERGPAAASARTCRPSAVVAHRGITRFSEPGWNTAVMYES